MTCPNQVDVTLTSDCGNDLEERALKIGIPAFPGAMGCAWDITGGRGGQVIAVTNLNDSGPGSLRDALLTPGPRHIVFNVDGEILLQSRILVSGAGLGNVTIHGHTAPGDGVYLRAANTMPHNTQMIEFREPNVIVRYLRFYPSGDLDFTPIAISSNDGVGVDGAGDVIFDHCSMRWTTDEICEAFPAASPINNVTYQYCIFAESLDHALHGNVPNENARGPLARLPSCVSYIRNLFIHNEEWNPRLEGGSTGTDPHQVINNVMYNVDWDFDVSEMQGSTGGAVFDWAVIGNYVGVAPANSADYVANHHLARRKSTVALRIWALDNITPNRPTGAEPQEDVVSDPSMYYDNAGGDIVLCNVDILDANAARADVLANAGAQWNSQQVGNTRDSADAQVVADESAHTGGILTDLSVLPYPTLTAGIPWTNTAGDNIDDAWKLANGYAVGTDYTGQNAVGGSIPGFGIPYDGTGYDVVEQWSHWLADQ